MAVEQRGGTVVVLTPMQLECRAMRGHLLDPERRWHDSGSFADIGRIEGVPWRVAVVATGEGNLRSAVLAERLHTWLRPVAVLVVGVAGSLKDDIGIGDVVVGTWIHGYQAGKEDDEGFHARPRPYPASSRLIEVARAVDLDGAWQAEPGVQRSRVHFKPIAAGDVVLNSTETALRAQLRRQYNDACAIETESAGAGAAAALNERMRVLTIRGISDKADGEKHLSDEHGLQPVAAAQAAGFAVGVLRAMPAALAAENAAGTPQDPTGTPRPAATSVQNIHAGPGGTVYAVQNGTLNTGEQAGPAPRE